MKESAIQRLILDYLAVKRVWCMRMNVGAMSGVHKGKKWFVQFGKPGVADILASHNGRFIWIEVKNEKGKQSETQKRFQDEVTEIGHTYILARSIDDLEAVIR